MNYLLASENGLINPGPASNLTPEDALTILIAVEGERMASELDLHLKKLVRDAESLQSQLKSRGIPVKILIEWGPCEEAISTCLAREQAILLR
ncbi:MAG TPA: hypothetical protein VJI13_02700 [Candidatus Norongarragalinales archaeon]|nr:hypothetical protein [Candidatus Norongarragalinales archaeon]